MKKEKKKKQVAVSIFIYFSYDAAKSGGLNNLKYLRIAGH